MPKILLCGYYGFGNFGDEIMRDITTEQIYKAFPDAKVQVLLPRNYLKRNNDKLNINRANPFAVIKALIQNDVLIFGGGSLFQDVTSFWSILYYSIICINAKVFGIKYILALHGLGPIRRKISRSLCSYVLRKAAYVSFRDEDSADLAYEISGKRFSHFADMAFLLKEKAQERTKHPGQKNVVYILRKTDPKIINELKSLVFWLKDRYNANIYFYVLSAQEDFDLSYAFALETGALLANHRTIDNMMSDLARMDLVISIKYHGVVMAACGGVDCIPVAYDPKIESLSNDLGLKIFGDRTYEVAARIMERTDPDAGYIEKIKVLYNNAAEGMDELIIEISKCLGYMQQ